MVNETVLVETIDELGERLRRGEFTVRELTEAYLERLEQIGPKLNAVVNITRERALDGADRLDKELTAGKDRGPLHGIPFGVKDLLAVKGYPTTWGAKPLKDQSFEETATIVKRLEDAGGVLLGKIAMVELAGGFGYDQADASFTGPGLNPWRTDSWSGGSSSGAGSAVPAGLVGFAIGSETWGSIVSPAGYCGIAGFRPTFGRISRHGAMVLSWTLDKLGPLCRSARGCEHVLRAAAGPDPADKATVSRPLDSSVSESPTVAVVDGAVDDAQTEVSENFEASLDVVKEFTDIETVELPAYPYKETIEIILNGEAAAAFEEFIADGKIEELQAPSDRVGGYSTQVTLAKDYINAMRIRRKIQTDLDELLAPYDALITPTLSSVAVPVDMSFETYREPYEIPPVGAAANIAGLPGITVPNGFGERNLPTGITFTGQAFDDVTVLELAKKYQTRTDYVDYEELVRKL